MQMDSGLARGLLNVLDAAHPLWPLYVGQPETGKPIELSKPAYNLIRDLLRASLDQSAQV